MAPTGKEGRGFMGRAVYSHLGRHSADVIVGPGWGLDNGIISVDRERTVIITVDPVSLIPEFGIDLSAWTSVHLIASDFCTSGARPEYATFSYNFPESMSMKEKGDYLKEVGDECKRLGVSIVGGHTGTYPGAGYTVIGTGSMFGFCNKREFVTPKMAGPGEAVILTKYPAIEAAASLALCFPKSAEERVGRVSARKVQRMIRLCSTVKDSTIASEAGLGPSAITSMHDATEGGVLGAINEMALASGKRFEIDLDEIVMPPELESVCGAFGIDPLTSLGEGALLITCNQAAKRKVISLLSKSGIQGRQIGVVESGSGLFVRGRGQARKRFIPKRDGYWQAYERFVARGLG